MAGRVGVRDTLAKFIANPPIQNLNQVFTSFPKRINFQVNALPGQMTRWLSGFLERLVTKSALSLTGPWLLHNTLAGAAHAILRYCGAGSSPAGQQRRGGRPITS